LKRDFDTPINTEINPKSGVEYKKAIYYPTNKKGDGFWISEYSQTPGKPSVLYTPVDFPVTSQELFEKTVTDGTQFKYLQQLLDLQNNEAQVLDEDGDVVKTKQEVETEQPIQNKEGIDFVFEQTPELAKIGSKEQYSQYLDTIFPDSQVKDIVYHFGNVLSNNFDKSFAEVDSKINKKGFQFATSIKTLLQYGVKGINDYLEKGDFNVKKMIEDKKLQSAILNTNNPFIDKNLGGNLENTNDAYARLDYNNNGKYIVFEPEQIHILGNKQDIEGFKKFVEQPINKEIKPNEVKGENITSKGSEFAKKLTNVGNLVGLIYKGKEYVNSEHAYQTWKSGEFNQAGYNLKGGKVRGGKIGDTFFIMTDILTEKLKQHPDLVQGINERGGLEYLQKSTHNVIGDKFWESTGQNKFIEALTQAYKNSTQPTEIKPKIDSSKKIENLKRGDIINFQQQEFLVERVKNEGIDVRDVNTGDVDFISTEDYINETQEQPIVEETKENWEDSDNECGI